MGSTTVRGWGLAGWVGRGLGRIGGLDRPDVAGWLMVVLVVVVVGLAYRTYCDHLRSRWSSIYHDRNAHYQAGLNIAVSLRDGDLLRAVLDWDAAGLAWPALHPTLLALVLTVAGPSPAAAVWPSLVGWAASAVLAFVIVRRLGGAYGSFGGMTAAVLMLASPALQALGSDVMLESLGLALTLACLYAYLLYCDRPTPMTGAVLGGLLATTFLHKYNYGGLVVLSLAAAEVLRRPGAVIAGLRTVMAAVPWRLWLANQLIRPLNYVIAGLLVFSAVVAIAGGWAWEPVPGIRWEVRQTRLFVHAAYAVALLRLVVWWWSGGQAAAARLLGRPQVTLLTVAAVPVALWFLLPFRLHYFFWYAGPGNAPPGLSHTLPEAVRYYGGGFVRDYHVTPLIAGVAAVWAVVGVFALSRSRATPAGWGALLCLWVIPGVLTLVHPNQQLRFLHTWAPVLWLVSGVGMAAMLAGLARGLGPTAARLLGSVALAGFGTALVAMTPAVAHVSPYLGRGYDRGDASLRDLYDAYLDRIDGREPTAVLTNLPDASWRWPFIERFGHHRGLRHNLREVGAFDPVTAAAAEAWVAHTVCHTVVFVEIPPDSPLYEPPVMATDNAALLTVLCRQSRFRLVHRVVVGRLGTVWIWQEPANE